ncbi:MAG: hypothetical protein JRN20_09825 [Nitrososphaerota archaeon]|nr:hypothetical protein [Nitrososphaerota archaeon]
MSEPSDAREEPVLQLLTKFGLSNDEAAIFVLLSRVNKKQTNWLKGSDISKLSKKGRVRTYQILQRLQSLGLINVNLSRPKRYATVSPQTAFRRLLSIEESRLTELSHLESDAIDSLRGLPPISVESILGSEEGKGKSMVSLLQGLANIQIALRDALAGSDISIAINEESADHIFTVLNFISETPKSARIIFSTPKGSLPKRYSLLARSAKGVELHVRAGSSPTFIVTRDVVMFLFYTKTSSKKRLLSPEITVNTASQLTLIESESYASQVRSVFDLILKNSNRVNV